MFFSDYSWSVKIVWNITNNPNKPCNDYFSYWQTSVETRGQVSYFENREISGFQSSLSPLRADLSHTKWYTSQNNTILKAQLYCWKYIRKFFNLKSMQEEEHVELVTFFFYIPNHIHRVTVKQLAHEKNKKNENGIPVLLIPPELLSQERRKPQFSQANYPFANSYQATLLALHLVKGVQVTNHHIPFSPLENMLMWQQGDCFLLKLQILNFLAWLVCAFPST